jgi:hypothetical protein
VAGVKTRACFSSLSQANACAKEEAQKIYAKSNKTVFCKPDDVTKGDLFAAEILLNEDSPGSWMAVVEVPKMEVKGEEGEVAVKGKKRMSEDVDVGMEPVAKKVKATGAGTGKAKKGVVTGKYAMSIHDTINSIAKKG